MIGPVHNCIIAMSSLDSKKSKPYQPPVLVKYGKVEDLTRMPAWKDRWNTYKGKPVGFEDGQKSKEL
jgi:hypothetical protein